MEYNHFEDTGIYYANKEMVENQLVLSMGSHLIYDISEADNVKTVMKATDEFFCIAQIDILKDGPCFYGKGSICREMIVNILTWEY